jgi:DNA-binding transcriptional MerR regulator
MCTVNHPVTANPGYLFETDIKSIAAGGALWTRMLAHHREVGLSCAQIQSLLDQNREYHERQVAIQTEFMQISEALEIKWGRVDAMVLAEREILLQRHAKLFAEHEQLFFEMAKRGHDLLTDEQIERAERIYHVERAAMVRDLAPAIERATGIIVGNSL